MIAPYLSFFDQTSGQSDISFYFSPGDQHSGAPVAEYPSWHWPSAPGKKQQEMKTEVGKRDVRRQKLLEGVVVQLVRGEAAMDVPGREHL